MQEAVQDEHVVSIVKALNVILECMLTPGNSNNLTLNSFTRTVMSTIHKI